MESVGFPEIGGLDVFSPGGDFGVDVGFAGLSDGLVSGILTVVVEGQMLSVTSVNDFGSALRDLS